MDYKFYLDSIIKNLTEGIIIVDRKANIMLYNEQVTNIAGVCPSEAIGKNILEVFPQLNMDTSTFYQVLKEGKPIIEHIQTYTNRQGKEVTIVSSVIPLKQNGEIVGALEVFRDFTQVQELSKKVLELQERYSKAKPKKSYSNNGAIYEFEDIVSKSKVMHDLITKAKRVAYSRSPILVYGETGTGKEILVQSIHNASAIRQKGPFIAQNCAALPKGLLESILFGSSAGSFTGAKDKKGLFELAHTGTLFLDEINSMDIELQGKLLRVLEDGVIRRIGGTTTTSVDVRIIASTNEEPKEAIKNKKLREDLFYRLNVIPLTIPPLRKRKEDIPLMVRHFINLYNKDLNKNVKRVSEEVMNFFLNYQWEGNVRELKYMIESTLNLIANKEVIEKEDLPTQFTEEPAIITTENQLNDTNEKLPDLPKAIQEYEIHLIKKAIKKANGNCALAARLLGIPRQTIHNKIKKYDICWETNL